jgi:hypothetical protein
VFSLAGMDRSGASSLSLVELLVRVGEKNGGGGEGGSSGRWLANEHWVDGMEARIVVRNA